MSECKTTTENDEGQLSLWDAVCLVVGIVIGSSVFETPGIIFSNVPTASSGLLLWVLCGALSFVGALCYAELATTYPRSGGEYNYLTRAYGSWSGFMFGWAQLAIIQTGSIGALAYVFANYATDFFQVPKEYSKVAPVWFALGAVIALTMLNSFGVRAGRRIQTLLVVAKLLGISLLVIAGLATTTPANVDQPKPISGPGWPLATILVLYAYGGWNDAAFVTAEVRNRSRNIPRALLLGIGAITLIYVMMNLAYLRALGFEGVRSSFRPAADTLSAVLGKPAGRTMSLLVMISSLGGLNGLVWAVSRVHAAVGADHPLFALLGRRTRKTGTPIFSLWVQCLVTIAMILAVGTESGQSTIDAFFKTLGIPAVPWSKYFGGFGTLYAASAPIFWLFFLATGIAYFVLRVRDKDLHRPFRAPLFPLCPLLFCGMSLFGLYSSVTYAAPLLPLVAVPFALGIPLYLISRSLKGSLTCRDDENPPNGSATT